MNTASPGPIDGQLPTPACETPRVAREKSFDEEAYLQQVADGEIPFSTTGGGNTSVKTSLYAKALIGHLSRLLNMDRKEVITLALCHYARCLTSAPITSLNDLGVLTQGLQLSLQDMLLEVQEYNELAVSVANQEAVSGSSDRA